MDETQLYERQTALYDLINSLDLQIQYQLFSAKIFNQDDLDHIKSAVTQQEKRLKLLNILQTRNYEASTLKEALEHCNQTYLLPILQLGLLTLQHNQQIYMAIAHELNEPHLLSDELKISKL